MFKPTRQPIPTHGARIEYEHEHRCAEHEQGRLAFFSCHSCISWSPPTRANPLLKNLRELCGLRGEPRAPSRQQTRRQTRPDLTPPASWTERVMNSRGGRTPDPRPLVRPVGKDLPIAPVKGPRKSCCRDDLNTNLIFQALPGRGGVWDDFSKITKFGRLAPLPGRFFGRNVFWPDRFVGRRPGHIIDLL